MVIPWDWRDLASYPQACALKRQIIKTGVNMCTRDMAETRRINVISELSCVVLEVWISTRRFSVTKIYKYFSGWI